MKRSISVALILLFPALVAAQGTFEKLVSCSGTQQNYQCTKGGRPFPLVTLSPADPIPAVLSPYIDPVFGTTVRRITPPKGNADVNRLWAPIYSTKSPFSAKGTYLLLYNDSGNYFLLSGQSYAPIHPMYFGNKCGGKGPWPGEKGTRLCAAGNGDSPSIHWMLSNDDCFLYFSSSKLVQYCVSKDRTTLIHDFGATGAGPIKGSSIRYVYTRDYNDFSDDDSRVAIEIHGTDPSASTIGFAAYDLVNDKILSVKTQCVAPEKCDFQFPIGSTLNSNTGHAQTSPSGRYLNMGWVGGGPIDTSTGKNASGIYSFDGFKFQRRVPCVNSGHADVGWDAQGNEVIATQCTDFGSNSYRAMHTFRFSDGYMIEYPFAYSYFARGGTCGAACANVYHISLQGTRGATKGYAVISTFTEPPNGTNPDVSTTAATGSFANAEVFLLYLGPELSPGTHRGNGRVYRLAHNQAIRCSYWAEPHATSDYNLTKIVWGSTWRKNPGDLITWPKDTGNTYVLDLNESSPK